LTATSVSHSPHLARVLFPQTLAATVPAAAAAAAAGGKKPIPRLCGVGGERRRQFGPACGCGAERRRGLREEPPIPRACGVEWGSGARKRRPEGRDRESSGLAAHGREQGGGRERLTSLAS